MVKVVSEIGSFLGDINLAIARFILLVMPVRPYEPPEIDFGWQKFKRTVRWRHIPVVIITLGIVLTVAFLLYQVPFLKYSMISVAVSTVNFIASKILAKEVDLSLFTIPVCIFLLIFVPSKVGALVGVRKENIRAGISSWALTEELYFRSGSEKWSTFQKARSCLAFGLLHFTNAFYPLSVTLALSLAGAAFMTTYMVIYKKTGSIETAVKESSTVHTVYNILGFTLIVILLLTYGLLSILPFFVNR